MENQQEPMICVICGADVCGCATDPGTTAAAAAVIDALLVGDTGPRHQARIVDALKRLYQLQAEVVKQ